MKNNKETGRTWTQECSVSRRNVITGGAISSIAVAAGLDAVLTNGRIQKTKDELQQIRPDLTPTQIEADRKLTSQYNNCQEITNSRCDEVISSEKLEQVHRAKSVMWQEDIYEKEVKEGVASDDLRLKLVDTVGGSTGVLSIIGVRIVKEVYDLLMGTP